MGQAFFACGKTGALCIPPRLLTQWLVVAVIALFLGTFPTSASPRYACFDGKGKLIKVLRGVRIEIAPGSDPDAPGEPICQLHIIGDTSKRQVVSAIDHDFSVLETKLDVNGDGIPDLIIEAYSGGAHCCWAYYIVALGAIPRLLHKIENDRAVSFYRDKNSGRVYLTAQDGVFDYFDGFCHACSVFPEITLRFEGDRIVDASSERMAAYDETITENQKRLGSNDREFLRSVTGEPIPDDAQGGPEAITRREPERAAHALSIALAYLYSGREERARHTLQLLWPPFDQERMWNSILDTRQKGLLCYTRGDSACDADPAIENQKKVLKHSYQKAPNR